MLTRLRTVLDAPLPLTPDGQRYIAMAQGIAQPRPYMLRWLCPLLYGTEPRNWRGMAYVDAFVLSVVAVAYTGAWAALFIPVGLAGVIKVNVRCPVLVDLHAMTWALLAAVFVNYGLWPLAIPAALIAGATKETAPIFAAAWAWSPIPLVGMLAPALAYVILKEGENTQGDHYALEHPFRAAWTRHKTQRVLGWWVFPLGVLVLGLASPTLQLGVCLGLAYGQCLVALDLVRLYSWAWPALALNLFDVVPRAWWLPLVVLHLANPAKGDGH